MNRRGRSARLVLDPRRLACQTHPDMGLLDRLLGKKPPSRNCDWCGVDFTGPGVPVDALVFCSEECRTAEAAPSKPPEIRNVYATKQMTLEDAGDALSTARIELRHFRKVVARSVESEVLLASPDSEGDIQQREFEFWRSLDDVRAVLVREGIDVSGYDALRERSMINSIELRHGAEVSAGLGLRGPKIVVSKSVTADFADGNIERMLGAIEALERALGR
ncbi:MAG: hypothetical protein HC927_08350 [Deltaproteobacteria bacterium]|nr:hypothetical protein [Deltaproteobacteria bacterium]